MCHRPVPVGTAARCSTSAVAVSNRQNVTVGGFSAILGRPRPHGYPVLHSPRCRPAKASPSSYPQLVDHLPRLVHRLAGLVHMVIHRPAEVPCLFLGSAYRTRETPGRGPGRGGFRARGKAVTMSRAGDTAIAAEVQHRRRVVVDVILLLMRNGRILLRERANTGFGDGAYEPPTGQLADRETIVETAIRVASAEAGDRHPGRERVARARHARRVRQRADRLLPHRVRLAGRVHLARRGWFGVGNLPTNMLDRSRVACGTTPRACAFPPIRRSARPVPRC
jgi:NUDIX domain.